MTRAMITVLGAVAGFIEGVVFFLIVNFSLDTPFRAFVSGEWIDYPSLIFGGVGAICGAITAWVVYGWTMRPRAYVSIPRKPLSPSDPPSKGPFG